MQIFNTECESTKQICAVFDRLERVNFARLWKLWAPCWFVKSQNIGPCQCDCTFVVACMAVDMRV